MNSGESSGNDFSSRTAAHAYVEMALIRIDVVARIAELLHAERSAILSEQLHIEKLLNAATAAGFSILDFTSLWQKELPHGRRVAWVFTNPQRRELVLLPVPMLPDGRVDLVIVADPDHPIPQWCKAAAPPWTDIVTTPRTEEAFRRSVSELQDALRVAHDRVVVRLSESVEARLEALFLQGAPLIIEGEEAFQRLHQAARNRGFTFSDAGGVGAGSSCWVFAHPGAKEVVAMAYARRPNGDVVFAVQDFRRIPSWWSLEEFLNN